MLDMKPWWYCKYQKINIRRYFTIYIIFNDKIAPDQCWYIIPYRLYDVTGRINPRDGLCLLSPPHWRVLKNGDSHYLVLQATSITKFYLTVYYFQHSLAQMSFIYCHLNLQANLLRPWPFPLNTINQPNQANYCNC
jgi:hypothetical protein